MAPSTFDHVVIPASAYSSTATDNHGLLVTKAHGVRSSPNSSATQQTYGGPRTHPRLLTVDEALQYSPLSSIVPLSLDTIPTPNAHITGSQPIFSTQSEKQASRRTLELLDKSLVKTKGQSELAQMALKTLRPCLDKNVITDFEFKEPAMLNGSHSNKSSSAHFNGQLQQSKQLGPFATLLLNATDLMHRYPTSSSPESASTNIRTLLQPSQKADTGPKQEEAGLERKPLVTPARRPLSLQNQEFPVQNDQVDVTGENVSVHEHAKPYPIVLIAPSIADTKPIDYVTLSDEFPSTDSSRKRKRDPSYRVSDGKTETKDQRAISDEAVRRLRELLQDIFEAEDQSRQDMSESPVAGASQILMPVYREEQEFLVLAPATHVKLEPMLQKVISLQRYSEFPLEQLSRLQGLCEGALLLADSSVFHPNSVSNSEDGLKWLQGVEAFDLGLRSTRTILRLMTGSWQEKQICSEELLTKVLSVVKEVVDLCLTPIVEARSSGPASTIFELASSNKKVVSQLLYDANKVMGLLAELLGKVDVAETVITELEFLATRILFVDNAHSEKDSVLGIQKFEVLRRTAMDLIAEIFSRYPEQQMFLVTEILTSLQKLPVNKQQARQYKLPEGKNIQLVSALIMRLIQTSANARSTEQGAFRKKPSLDEAKHSTHVTLEDEETDSDSTASEGNDSVDEPKSGANARYSLAMQRLNKEANRLSRLPGIYARYVIGFYVKRATNVSKTGDQPHRNLLDLFAEDLIGVLGLPDWPAAELLLRALLLQMCEIAENKKYNVSEKSMALELLGLMGSAISELGASVRHSAKALENQESLFSGYLRQLLDDYMEGKLEPSELLGWEGPYRAAVEYLRQNDSGDKHIESAQGYILTQWAKASSSVGLEASEVNKNLANQLRKLLTGRSEKSLEWSMESISSAQGRLSYALTVLNLPFCQQSDRVLKILLDSAGSEQSSVRTKGLKSVTQMLEQDPSLLDGPRNVKSLILRCASDASSKVRDSALTLIGKCILLKPALEQEFCMAVLGLSNDPAILVKKRAMRLLQDMYLRNSQKEVKAAIADSLLQRVKDHDTGVADLARQSLEEIWFSPYAKLVEATDLSVQDKISLQLQIGQIVGTAQRGESVSSTMVGLFQDILSNKSKMAATNFKICKALVAIAFEGMIDSGDLPGDLEQTHILQTLTVFARANAKLFAAEQLQYLQPYITNLSNPDDLNIFRSVVVVFRCVLPILSVVQHGFLRDVQTALLHSIAKLGRTEMDEVAACLWTINGTLKDPEKLIKLTVSVLKNLRALEGVEFSDPKHIQDLHRVRKYVRIAGYFGKHCDFEGHSKWFQQSLPWWKGKSVAGLIVGALTPFAKAQQPLSLRADALDAIGLICQSWPFQFNQETVSRMFEEILTSGEPELQKIVLSSFRDFFAKQERHAEGKGDIPAGGDNPENGKLGGSMTASDGDGASALIAQRFLRSVLQIALASQDQSALTATQVIASINRQGLVHPKESGPALVALETSTNKDIAEVAFQAHRSLHQQHESMFEREYMRAIQETFRYQRDIVKDAQGAIGQPPTSKLCALFEIIKTSKGKYQRKFLDNFCSKINFDAPKLEWDGGVCTTLQYSRFLIENLAFFDYGRMEELLHTVSCMERIVASTGSGIAHSISTDIFHVKVESLPEGRPDGAQRVDGRVETPSGDVSPQRLHQLAVCAIILLCVWDTRTYLRRLYGLQSSQQKRDSKTKASVKDLNRVPSRAQGVSGERLLRLIAERICSLDSTDGMVKECKELVELLSIDNELKVEAEDGEEVTQTETLSGDDAPETSTPARGGPRPQKRKGSLSVNGSPQKRKRERPTVGPRKRSGQIINNHEGERN